MPSDREIYFNNGAHPSFGDVVTYIEDFIGDAEAVRWDEKSSRFYVELPGPCSDPLRRLRQRDGIFDVGQRRQIEVWLDEQSIDVMVRHGDPFTSGVAARLASDMASWFGGKREWREDWPSFATIVVDIKLVLGDIVRKIFRR